MTLRWHSPDWALMLQLSVLSPIFTQGLSLRTLRRFSCLRSTGIRSVSRVCHHKAELPRPTPHYILFSFPSVQYNRQLESSYSVRALPDAHPGGHVQVAWNQYQSTRMRGQTKFKVRQRASIPSTTLPRVKIYLNFVLVLVLSVWSHFLRSHFYMSKRRKIQLCGLNQKVSSEHNRPHTGGEWGKPPWSIYGQTHCAIYRGEWTKQETNTHRRNTRNKRNVWWVIHYSTKGRVMGKS